MDLEGPVDARERQDWGMDGGQFSGQLQDSGSGAWNNCGPPADDCGEGDDAFAAGLKQISGHHEQPQRGSPAAGEPTIRHTSAFRLICCADSLL